jgi:hypothetical protein
MARMAAFEASFRTDCASANLATTFDAKKHVRAFKATTAPSSSDVDQQVLDTNLKILEMGKLFESHSKLNMLRQTRGGGRGGGRGGPPSRARRGERPPVRATPEQSCLWCAEKGHTIFDCPSPPTPAAKKVRDDLVAKRAAKVRNDDRKARRLATAATSAIVSDDESDGEGDDLVHTTFAALQAIFAANEITKPSCFRVVSQDSVDPSPASSLFLAQRQKVVCRVSKLVRYHHVVYCLRPLLLLKVSFFKHPTPSVTSLLSSMLWRLNLVFVVGLATPLRPNFPVFFNFRPIITTKITMYTLYVMRLFSPFGLSRISRAQLFSTLVRHVQLPTILLKRNCTSETSGGTASIYESGVFEYSYI